MPQIEHRLYEPGEDVTVFEDDQDEAENSRLPLLIVLALLVLAMFGGFVWLAYNEGVAHGRSENPLFASDQGTSKAAATGSSHPFRGFKIYEQPAPPDDDVTGQTSPQAATAARTLPAKTAAAPAARAAAKPAPAKPKPAPAATSAPVAKPKAMAAPKPPPAGVVAAKAAPAPGAYVLQIGAYKSEAEANAAWGRYRGRHAALLQGFGSQVVKADLGQKGIWYRLRITGFASRDAAESLCGRLKDDGGACFLGR